MPRATALDPAIHLGIAAEAMPKHVAIIMDGNGRWAAERGLIRAEGHKAGVVAVRETITHCGRLGLRQLTLYSFSSENWKRPREEVDALMTLYAYHLVKERDEIMDNNVRLVQIGRRAGLPDDVLAKLDETTRLSAGNTGLTLALALNYGARTEIVDATRKLAQQAVDGKLRPEDIDEEHISGALYTAGLDDPDLVIRTAGEMRLSNFLLWQASYAEFHAMPVLWPDFRPPHLDDALRAFARRERRYGDVPEIGDDQSSG